MARLQMTVKVATAPVNTLVNGWVRQLVAGQLGPALQKAEKRLGKTLRVDLDADSIAVIQWALRRR